MTEHYLGVLGVAEALGVTRHAVHKWRSRHPAGSDRPFPEPDVEIDGAPGWRPDRVEEIVRWRDGLPGRGVGGGRPSAARQDGWNERIVASVSNSSRSPPPASTSTCGSPSASAGTGSPSRR